MEGQNEGRREWNKGRKESGRETGRERQKNECRKAIKVEWNGRRERVREEEMKGRRNKTAWVFKGLLGRERNEIMLKTSCAGEEQGTS